MKNNYFKKSFSIAILGLFLLLTNLTFVLAQTQGGAPSNDQTPMGKLGSFSVKAKLTPAEGRPTSPATITINLIKYALGLLGIISVIMIIIAGFQWMTSGGNGEVIKKAKARIINATIGLAIVLGAYVITLFITKNLINLTK